MRYSLVVAIGNQGQIGLDNKLLWHLPADLKNFRKITAHHVVLMGRKTFESIGKPLPNRLNLVLSKGPKRESIPGQLVFIDSIDQVLSQIIEPYQNKSEIMVIGGAQIYKELLPLATKMYMSQVNYNGPADAYFPKWEKNEWKEEHVECFQAEPNTQSLAWSFHQWVRK